MTLGVNKLMDCPVLMCGFVNIRKSIAAKSNRLKNPNMIRFIQGVFYLIEYEQMDLMMLFL